MTENEPAASTSSTFLMMSTQDAEDWPVDNTYSDNRDGSAEAIPCANEEVTRNTDAADDATEDGNEEIEIPIEPVNSPMPSSEVGCSTERTIHKPVHDNTATPSGPTKRKIN